MSDSVRLRREGGDDSARVQNDQRNSTELRQQEPWQNPAGILGPSLSRIDKIHLDAI